MSHEPDDTPPEHNVLGYLMRLSSDLGEVRAITERHVVHLSNLRQDVMAFRDDVRELVPRVEDHTGRLKRLEAASRIVGGKLTLWKGISIGVLGLAAVSAGAIGALAAMGVFK